MVLYVSAMTIMTVLRVVLGLGMTPGCRELGLGGVQVLHTPCPCYYKSALLCTMAAVMPLFRIKGRANSTNRKADVQRERSKDSWVAATPGQARSTLVWSVNWTTCPQ